VDLELRHKVVAITGGTDGLGLALAQRLQREGARVAVCGRDKDRRNQAQALLGDEALCVQADITDAGDADRFIDTVLDRWDRLDGLVNNAGKSAAGTIQSSTDDAWRDDYELKVIAALHLTRRAIPVLIEKQGAIVNVLATMARTPGLGTTPTAASRAAGLAFTKALSAELAPEGVRANAILIGLIESGQWVRRAEAAGVAIDDFYRNLAAGSRVPLGRVGKAEEFADLAAYLLSPRAGYLTGIGIALDGGLSPVI
jgi:NAD(P)-dependent dehydrogenase (short-subunit alcohol dehydrogenase family)